MKKILCLFLMTIIIMSSLAGCGKKSGESSTSGSTPVVLNEVAHSIE